MLFPSYRRKPVSSGTSIGLIRGPWAPAYAGVTNRFSTNWHTYMPSKTSPPDKARLDRVVAEARRNRELREQTYREPALRIYPWICGRGAREFPRGNLPLS